MSGTGGYQTQVNATSAPAVAGDFASLNPWFSYDAGPGGLVAGAGGVTIGRFAWVYPPVDPNGANKVALNTGTGVVAGFVHMAQQGLITTYLANAGMVIAAGFQMALMTGGDFWVKNEGLTASVIGQKAYAAFANGAVNFAATGAPLSGATSTSSTITAQTGSFTGSLVDDVLTVTAVGAGTIVAGGVITGTAGVVAGTKVVSQLSGTIGGVGVYLVDTPGQSVLSSPMTETYGLLTVGGSLTGTFGLGGVVTGTGVTAGTTITQLGTGSGGAGTYIVSPTQAMSASAVGMTGNVETKWYATSVGAAGALVKISDHPPG